MLQFIYNNLDAGYTVLSLFLDFRKSLDCVDHSILLNNLKVYGVRGVALLWFQSYFSERLQYVSINGNNSDYLSVKVELIKSPFKTQCSFQFILMVFLKAPVSSNSVYLLMAAFYLSHIETYL